MSKYKIPNNSKNNTEAKRRWWRDNYHKNKGWNAARNEKYDYSHKQAGYEAESYFNRLCADYVHLTESLIAGRYVKYPLSHSHKPPLRVLIIKMMIETVLSLIRSRRRLGLTEGYDGVKTLTFDEVKAEVYRKVKQAEESGEIHLTDKAMTAYHNINKGWDNLIPKGKGKGEANDS